MLKKLNNTLLSRFPLLWNTKIIYVLPAALLIHFLFYAAGFLTPFELTDLSSHRIFEEQSVNMFSVLVSLITIIVWLTFYLRNNPFKSFYTLSRNYLFAEFLLIALVFFSSTTFFLSYKQGLYATINNNTKNIDLEKEVNTLNLSAHFIAFEYEQFDINSCCDTIIAQQLRDSLYEAENTRRRKMHLPLLESPNTYNSKAINAPYQLSYLNYCKQRMYFWVHPSPVELLNKYQLNTIATQWLKENKKDSVRQLLTNLTTLCDKYGGSYNFNVNEQVNECFADSNYTVTKIIQTDPFYDDNDKIKGSYIDFNTVERSLQKIAEIRRPFLTSGLFLIWLYSTLAASVLLFTFRITRLKHWFIGLIGIGLWAVILVLIALTLKLQDGMLVLVLFVWLLLFIIAAALIKNKGKKLYAGIIYNWVFWFTPFVLPLIVAYIQVSTNETCFRITPENQFDCRINEFINNNWVPINSLNYILVVALIFFVFIPLARKWQSNPDE